ncbi:MAG: acetolactate synthase large subunit [Bdellovibrionales bacterium]|nr:acetolactate synthase large subunit [Bdellovibrionales bacterium]
MTTAELFVSCLEREGVTTIFGVPGEENAHLMMALQNSSIKFVLTRHEQGAAFMADVYGRLTGEAGVCLATLGPGATNLVTGVADGNMDRAPMVVITAQAGMQRQHKESHQHMDVVAMFKPITKWAATVVHPDNIPEIVRKAFKLATTEKPGACHIELPEDIMKLCSEKLPISPERLRRPVADNKIIDKAMALILNAKRPIILAGNGAIRKRASQQLQAFAAQTGIGVISTFMGKGAVPRSSPQCLYTVGLQAKDIVSCAIDASDLVISIGYDLVEYHPWLWNSKGDKQIIHVDFLPAEIDSHYLAKVEIIGDIAHTLWMFNERIKGKQFNYDLKQQGVVRTQMFEEISAHKNDRTEGTIRPQKALWDVRQAMGPSDILLSDVGAHKMWTARYYAADDPNTCLISNGFCSMGFALPGAIAAKMVYPDRKVIAICGDGGFLMNVQEMETAKRIGANIVAMVWEDGGYGLIEWKQNNEFGKHTELSFGNPDWVKLADSFGWVGMRINNAIDLAPALNKAFSLNVPCLIVIPIDYRENALLTQRLGNIACPI